MQPTTESIPGRMHREAMAIPIQDVARFLMEVMPARWIAYLAGLNDARPIRHLAGGENGAPLDSAAEERLRSAYYIMQLLLFHDSPGTARSWFLGMNPELDFTSPLDALRDGNLKDAEIAAHVFFVEG